MTNFQVIKLVNGDGWQTRYMEQDGWVERTFPSKIRAVRHLKFIINRYPRAVISYGEEYYEQVINIKWKD